MAALKKVPNYDRTGIVRQAAKSHKNKKYEKEVIPRTEKLSAHIPSKKGANPIRGEHGKIHKKVTKRK